MKPQSTETLERFELKQVIFRFGNTIFCLILIAFGSWAHGEQKESQPGTRPLKKISVVESNNGAYFLSTGDGIFAKRDASYLKELKGYVEKHGFRAEEKNGELDFILTSLKWVSSQWDHDGMNEPAKDAKGLDVLREVYDNHVKFRCVEYGLVLSDLLQAYGFVTRPISLRSVDVAYGKPGSGHVAAEVWVNSLDKWIFLDVQFGLYLTVKGGAGPLNYYEIYQQKKIGKWDELELHFLKPSKTTEQDKRDYKEFLAHYFGFLSVSDQMTGSPRISLFLETQKPTLTFQGRPLDDVIFTDDVRTLYPAMNKVSMILRYKTPPPDFKTESAKLKIQTEQDYLNKMPQFAAVPEYIVTLKTNEPNFDHFEYRKGANKWTSLELSELDWNATRPLNRLETRAVNQFGRPGPTTYMEIQYK